MTLLALVTVALNGCADDKGDPAFEAKASDACAQVLAGREARFESTLPLPVDLDIAEYDELRSEQQQAFNDASDQIDSALGDLRALDAPGGVQGTFEELTDALTDVSDIAEQNAAVGPIPDEPGDPMSYDTEIASDAADEQDADEQHLKDLADELGIDCP